MNKCKECHRVFHMDDRDDADEWYYGHDCEENPIAEDPSDDLGYEIHTD